jgi:hypothetical protein
MLLKRGKEACKKEGGEGAKKREERALKRGSWPNIQMAK